MNSLEGTYGVAAEGGVSVFLRAYGGADSARFHMPGHKGRGRALGGGVSWDITEIPGADNLLAPEGILARAQGEAAAFFGAEETFFLNGGSSQGMQAALLALPADCTVFASRDCHKSLVAGLGLSGHALRFLAPVLEGDGRLALPGPEDVAAALSGAPVRGPRALVITRPDYFGRCADLPPIADLCRREGVILIVDEAHGAHFPFSPELPDPALPHCHISFASAHKTLDAPNPAAYLHLSPPSGPAGESGPTAPDGPRLARAVRLLGSTSPSYPLLAALDDCWRGQSQPWAAHLRRLSAWRASLPSIWQEALAQGQSGPNAAQRDSSRLCFQLEGGAGGHPLYAHLLAANIVMEMADSHRTVAITSPLDPDEWYDRLGAALLAYQPPPSPVAAFQPALAPPPLPETVCTVREALLAPAETVSEAAAIGRICARSVGAYPPGAALICPGERIDKATLDYITTLRQTGASLFGFPLLCLRRPIF